MHSDVNDALHSMMVAYSPGSYVRPNRHKGKDESVLVARGACIVCFFDGAGTITRAVNLHERGTPAAYYCRLPAETFHTVLVPPSGVVLYESTPGPFVPEDTEYAVWAPEEGYQPDVQRWQDRAYLASAVKAENHVSPLTTHGEAVLVASAAVVTLGDHEEHVLKEMVRNGLSRCRICAHKSEKDRLHEMLVCFAAGTTAPSRHKADETLYALEGQARYVFYDDQGKETRTVHLPAGTVCRVPAGRWHSLVAETPFLALEATSGPFRKSDTEYAPWEAP